MSFESPTPQTPESTAEKEANIKKLAKSHIKEEGLMTRLGEKYGKVTRAFVLMSTLAAVTAYNNVEKTNAQEQEATTASSEADKHDPRVKHMRERLRESRETQLEQLQRARELASEMDIELGNTLNITLEGGVVTVINGEPVPEHLFTPEEQKQVNAAREMRRVMDEVMQESEAQGTQEEGDGTVLKRGGSDEEAY